MWVLSGELEPLLISMSRKQVVTKRNYILACGKTDDETMVVNTRIQYECTCIDTRNTRNAPMVNARQMKLESLQSDAFKQPVSLEGGVTHPVTPGLWYTCR